MINDIKQAIADKLLALYPDYHVYDEDIAQNFKTPSFVITVIDQDYGKRLNRTYRSSVAFDLAYFSDKGTGDVKNDCYRVQTGLLKGLDLIGTYRAYEKNASITDDVLHVTFRVNYSEMVPEDADRMQQLEDLNTNI